MLRSKLNSNRFSKVSLTRRFYLIGFTAPEGELLAFNRLSRLGWSFNGTTAWMAETLSLAAWPPRYPAKIKAKSTVGYASRTFSVSKSSLKRYAMRTLRGWRDSKCRV